MTKSLKTADGKYWVGDNINPSDFLLIKARMYGFGDGNVTFVVEKSELDKIPNSSTWSTKDKAEAFVEVKNDVSDEYQYSFVAVVSDPTEVKNYVKGYNHSVYSLTVIPNANEQYEDAVGKYEFTINSKNSNMYAKGGKPNSRIEKLKFEILEFDKYQFGGRKTLGNKNPTHFSPKELQDKGSRVREIFNHYQGKGYSVEEINEALGALKYEDGGAVGVGGTMDTSMEDAPMIGGTMDSSMYAKGGLIVTSIKDIPNFQQRLDEGKITYRGLGMGKVMNDFFKIAGESGTRIKVDGKEYYITDTEFNTFSRGADGRMRIKFDAPHRRSFAKGGNVGRYSKIDLVVKNSWGNEEIEVAKFKGMGDAIISADALEKNSPSNYQYSVSRTNKYAKGGAVHYTSKGKLRMKKMYNDIGDYLPFAKVGDAIWIGNDPSEFEYASKSHLWKVQEVRPTEIIVKAFGRTGSYNLSAKSFSQKVIVVGDNTYAKGGSVGYSVVAYANQDYDNQLGTFNSLAKAKQFAHQNNKKYDSITFEDEFGDNIVVTNEDTPNDIEYLFTDQYAKGGTVKPNKRTLDKIANVYFDLFDVVGAESGGELREDKAMLAKFAKLLEDKVSKIIAKKSLSEKDFDYYENNNYHLLNEFLSWNDYFATNEFKDMYKRLAKQYKRSNSTLADPKYIVVKSATVVAPKPPVMAEPTPLATPTESISGKPNYKVNAQIKSVKFTTKSGKTKTVSGDMVLNGAHYFKKGGSIKADYEYFPKATIVEVVLIDGSKIKPLNGYWISKTVKFGNGGGVKPFEYTANGAKIYINGTKADVKAMYLDYVNNFLTIEGFADYYGISDAQAKSILKAGKEYAEKDGYYAQGGELGGSFEVVVVSQEANKDGGRKHKDRFLVDAETRAEAIAQATKMWKADMDSSDLSIVEVLTADEYREKYLKPKFAEGGNVGNIMSFEEFKKTKPVLHNMIVLDNSVEYKPMYDKYSGTTKYFRHGRRNLKSFTLREAYEHYEYFASKGKEYADGGRTRQYDGLNEQDKFIADQIYHVIGLRLISEKKNVIQNSILPNLDIYNLEKNPKRIVKDNLEYALTLKTPSAINDTMEATINALRSSTYAKGGVADDVKNFFGGIGRTVKSGYEKTRDFTNKQIHDQKKNIALEVIDDTKDKVRTNRDKMDLKGAEEIVEDHYADGGMVKNPTKAQYESYLNGLGTPSSDHPDNGGRVSRKMIEKYGTWLRKNDPIAFEVGYNEFRAQ